MRKILIITFAVLFFTTVAFAGVVTQGGFRYTPLTKTYSGHNDYGEDNTIWNPSGNYIVLMGITFSSNNYASFSLSNIDDAQQVYTTVIPTIYNTASGVITIGNGTPIWQGTDALILTTTGTVVDDAGTDTGGDTDLSVILWGYEK